MNETIPLVWHADVNLFHLLSVLYGAEARYRSNRLFGYHCTYTRQLTPARARDGPGYDAVWAQEVTRVDLRKRRKRWALPKADVEGLSVRLTRLHVDAMNMPLTRNSGKG